MELKTWSLEEEEPIFSVERLECAWRADLGEEFLSEGKEERCGVCMEGGGVPEGLMSGV